MNILADNNAEVMDRKQDYSDIWNQYMKTNKQSL